MLVSIVGQAIFHTAGRSGPSMIDRSYRRAPGVAEAFDAGVASGWADAETSVIEGRRVVEAIFNLLAAADRTKLDEVKRVASRRDRSLPS